MLDLGLEILGEKIGPQYWECFSIKRQIIIFYL